jgi:hypothetical protein
MNTDKGVAWVYQNNDFIDIEVGYYAQILANKLKY